MVNAVYGWLELLRGHVLCNAYHAESDEVVLEEHAPNDVNTSVDSAEVDDPSHSE